eukprot:12396-Heterococcus_DN1.PRE.3
MSSSLLRLVTTLFSTTFNTRGSSLSSLAFSSGTLQCSRTTHNQSITQYNYLFQQQHLEHDATENYQYFAGVRTARCRCGKAAAK